MSEAVTGSSGGSNSGGQTKPNQNVKSGNNRAEASIGKKSGASPNEKLSVSLEVIAGPESGSSFQFHQHDTFVVGRSSKAHLRISEDRHFSRYHFRIETRPPECLLIDLGSRNGTFVNNERVTEVFLKNGDIISGGRTQIRTVITAPQTAKPADKSTKAEFVSNADSALANTVIVQGKRAHLQPLPGYEFWEQLGEGAMGVVYHAKQKSKNQDVAVKMIIPQRSCERDVMELFVREASVMRKLEHPHIVRCHEFGIVAGQFFIVMEYVPHQSFESIVEGRSDNTRIQIACGIICQILEALEYAHRASIVHRDVKPGNILLSRRGNRLDAKLSDFGLAKNFDNAGFSELTRSGDIRGTIAYMPPEQIIDCRYARPAADIYASASTLYRLLTGHFPFEFERRNKLAVVLDDEPIPLQERSKAIPSKLAEIVHRALLKDPQMRFPSATSMRQALLPFTKPLRPN